MKHLYLVGYKRRDRDGNYIEDGQGNLVKDWSLQIGIGATRLMAQRKHNYSYLDLTPRKATQEEIDTILGDTADPNSIYGFVHLKDVDTGAEAFGLRGIGNSERIKGEEKGNTHLNMACVRAERLALDRQYPGEMPQGLEVVDERFIEADYRVVDETGGAGESPLKDGEKIGATASTKQPKAGAKATKTETPPAAEETSQDEAIKGEGFTIDLPWLKESQKTLKWTDDTVLTFIIGQYKVSGTSVTGALNKLTREQAEDFVNQINKRLEKQTSLF
ncbi:hypothetical protein ES705_42464 [subsurface metagenome]